jgi:hypothetical protein
VAQIAASIIEFGFNAPVLVDSHSGIIAGHGRMLAARKLGLKEVPVVVLDHLSDTQRRAYILADNKLAENAGWDEKVLAAELADLEHDGLDLNLVGFSDRELDVLLADDGEDPLAAVDEEILEPPAEPVTRPGDVWLIGSHRLICGGRDRDTVTRLFDGRKANATKANAPGCVSRIVTNRKMGAYFVLKFSVPATRGMRGGLVVAFQSFAHTAHELFECLFALGKTGNRSLWVAVYRGPDCDGTFNARPEAIRVIHLGRQGRIRLER